MFLASGALSIHDCMPEKIKQKNSCRIAKQFLRHYRFLSQRSCPLSRDRHQLSQQPRQHFSGVLRFFGVLLVPGCQDLGVFQRPLTLILLQKYRDTNGRRIVIQIGGVYTTFCQEEGLLLQKYRDRNGRCIAILFKSIGVRGEFSTFQKDVKRTTTLHQSSASLRLFGKERVECCGSPPARHACLNSLQVVSPALTGGILNSP